MVSKISAFVLSGLVKRRAELAGDIEKAHESLRRMVLAISFARPNPAPQFTRA
jgi:hypothetical protein